MKKLTQRDIDNFIAEQSAEIYGYVKNIPIGARQRKLRGHSIPLLLPEQMQAYAEHFQDYYADHLLNGEESATETFFKEHLAGHFDIAGMEREIAEAASRYDVLLHQSQRASHAFWGKDLITYQQILSTMPPPAVPSNEEVPDDKPTINLQDAWDGFCKYKSDWSPKIRQTNEKYFEVILAVLGADKSVNVINQRDIKELLVVVAGMPQQNRRPYNRMTINECLEYDVPIEHQISAKTVKDYLKLCQGLFSTYLTGELGILESPPTQNIKYEAQSQSYGNYSNSEMRKLVVHFKTLSGWNKWIPLLLAYTGARRTEIFKLLRSDIRIDEDTQRYYLMITETKTDAGTRQIPLSNKLISEGFIDYISTFTSKEKIFPEITEGNQVTNWFHRVRDALEIPLLDDFGARRVVHSFRHTFVTEALSKNNDVLGVQQLVGHEHSNMGQTQRYTHRFRVRELLGIIDSIDWE